MDADALKKHIDTLKNRFIKTTNADEENDLVFAANQANDHAVDHKVIDPDTWKITHDDICDWGMQKTLAECERWANSKTEKCYKDIPF